MNINNWLAVISALVLLSLIISIKKFNWFNQFDRVLHRKLIHNHDNFFLKIIAFINDPKLLVVWAVFLAAFLLNENKFGAALWVLFTLGVTDFIGIILKKWMRRKRPLDHSNLEAGYSFPSGHVLGATSMALILVKLFGTQYGTKFIVILAVIWLSIISSRLILKAHYPSDIIGATSLAVFCFSITVQIFAGIF